MENNTIFKLNVKPKCRRFRDPKDNHISIQEADPNCKTCKGHGTVDVGWYHCILEMCPECIEPFYEE